MMCTMSQRAVVPLVSATAVAVLLAGVLWVNIRPSSGGQEHPTTEQLITELAPGLPPTQSDLLADGVLTSDEYEGAIERSAQCMEAAGLSVTRHPGAGVGDSTALEVAGDLRAMSLEEIRSAHINCVETHQGRLGIVWAEMHRPSAEQLAREAQTFDECVTDAGFAYALPDARASIVNPVDGPYPFGTPEYAALWDCQMRVQEMR
jgi:hypothetical protein